MPPSSARPRPWLALLLACFGCGASADGAASDPLALCPQLACQTATARSAGGTCTYEPKANGVRCEDGNPCTVYTTCTAGTCGGGSLAPDGTACDDQDACTQNESCRAGRCGGGAPVVCPAAGPCRAAAQCDAKLGCVDTRYPACVEKLPSVALSGCVDGGYAAKIGIGGKDYALLADTGSSTTAVAAATCTNCTVAPTYPMAGRQTQGSASSQYSDGTGWRGDVVLDQVSVAGGAAEGNWLMTFAAIAAQQNNFFAGMRCSGTLDASAYQGILGLGPQRGAGGGTTAFIDAAITGNALVGDAFSVGLCDRGGRLWLGGYDPASVTQQPVFTPMLTPATAGAFYGIAVDDVALGSASLGQSSFALGPAYVDTGTSGLLLPLTAYASLVAGLRGDPNFVALFGTQTVFADATTICAAPARALAPAQLDALLPPLTLTIPQAGGGAKASLQLAPTQSYLVPQQQAQSGGGRYVYCTGAYPTGRTTVLGAAVLRGLVVVFDRIGNQIGFAAQQGCSGALPQLGSG